MTPSPSFGRGIFDTEKEGPPYKRSTNNFPIRQCIEDKTKAAKKKKGEKSPPKTPIAELEIIKRRMRSGSSVYYTLLKPGCDTIGGFPSAPPIPDLFKGLRSSSSGDIAVGDIDYSKKRTVKPNANSPHSGHSGTIVQDCSTSIKTTFTPPQAVISPTVPSRDSEMSDTATGGAGVNLHPASATPTTSDAGGSLYPEPSTPRTPRTTSFSERTNISCPSLVLPEDSYSEMGSPSESFVFGFGDCSDDAISEGNSLSLGHNMYQYHLINKRISTLQDNYQQLRSGFLDIGGYTSRFEKEVKKLETRVQLLETKAGIKEKPEKRKKNKRALLVKKKRDGCEIYIIQHINRLIELREFMEKLKEIGPEKTKGGSLPINSSTSSGITTSELIPEAIEGSKSGMVELEGV